MSLKLISFPICPFVQRAIITLREKGVAHDIENIDIRDKPAWFMELSPRGKVPVLMADGVPLFESQAIVEYLEEVYPQPPLAPADPVGRARDRAWFSMADEDLIVPIIRALRATDQGDFLDQIAVIERALGHLEQQLTGRDWLSGDGSRFGLADVGVAPFFFRVQHLSPIWQLPESMPAVRAWSQRLLARQSVSGSVPDQLYQEGVDRMMQPGWVRWKQTA